MTDQPAIYTTTSTILKKFFSDLSLKPFGADQIQTGQRYGDKIAAIVSFGGQEYPITLLRMNPGGSTGKVLEGSLIDIPLPTYHPAVSLEWVIPIAFLNNGDAPQITHYVFDSSGALYESHESNTFPSLVRAVETEEILIANPQKPQGHHFKLFGPHMLSNPSSKDLVILIRTVEKGTPLTDLDRHFIDMTGGIGKYLVANSTFELLQKAQ